MLKNACSRLVWGLIFVMFSALGFAANCPGKAFIELTNRTKQVLYCGKELAIKGGLDEVTATRGPGDALKPGETVRLGFYAANRGRSGSVSCSPQKNKTLKGAVITMIVTVIGDCHGGKYDFTISAMDGYRATYASCLGTDYQETINPIQGERDIFRTLAISLFPLQE